jgi:hypothetical protein
VEEHGHRPDPEPLASSPGCRRPGGLRRGNPARHRPHPRQHRAAPRPSARAGDVTDGHTTTHPTRTRTAGTGPTATTAAPLDHRPANRDRPTSRFPTPGRAQAHRGRRDCAPHAAAQRPRLVVERHRAPYPGQATGRPTSGAPRTDQPISARRWHGGAHGRARPAHLTTDHDRPEARPARGREHPAERYLNARGCAEDLRTSISVIRGHAAHAIRPPVTTMRLHHGPA